MIYVLYGEEQFLIDQEMERIKEGLGPQDMLALNTVRLVGKDITFPELQAHSDTVPFLADYRLVVVEGLLERLDARRAGQRGESDRDAEGSAGGPGSRRGRPGAPSGWDQLEQYSANVPETTCLVFIDGPLQPQNRLLSALKAAAKVQEFRKLRGQRLDEWARAQASKQGVQFSPDALRLLLQVVGDNLRMLSSEMEKLSLYAGDAPVQPKDVHELVASARETTIYALIDSVAEQRLANAQHALHQLLRDGWSPPQVLVRLAQQYRQLLLTKALQERKLTGRALMERLGMRSEFPFNKTVDQARRYSAPALQHALEQLLDADMSLKTGKLPPEVALELLVTDLCRGAVRS